MKDLISRSLFSLAALTAIVSADNNASAVNTDLGVVEVVDTKEKYRNRTSSVTPSLVYDNKFFERFEPITSGEMLKRVPGVIFKGDVGEYDFIQLRGLASAYTQVLINGKRILGNGADREINLDRIPAEMVERIEIVRSPSSELDSQGVAGTINIILKDGASMDGFYYRVGVSRHSNGEDNDWTEEKYKPNLYLSYGENLENMSYTVSGYYQERYNAKDKITNEHEDGKDDANSWVYTEDEWDNRDTKDLSLYAKADIDLTDSDSLILSGNYFFTDREEEQYEFKNERDSVDEDFELDEIEHQIKDIEQKSFNLDAEYLHTFASEDELKITATYDNFSGTLDEFKAEEGTNNRDDWKNIKNIKAGDHEVELTETDDEEFKTSVGYAYNRIKDHEIKVGLQGQMRKRDTTFKTYEVEDGAKSDVDVESLGTHKIDENRLDAYAEDTWKINPKTTLQFGGRVEYTDVEQEGTEGKIDHDYTHFNPNIHLKYQLTGQDKLRISLAQTVRRPNFDEMVPFEADDEPADYDLLVGNPDLEPEKSIGIDIGYEHAFANQFGIIGANIFHRSVKDKIEHKYLSVNEVEDDGEIETGGRYTFDNVGDGKVYGFEFDSSFPLSFIGVPSVNLFANYTYLDSEIDDPFTGKSRRFNDQPEYVYNVGLNHTLKPWNLSYGVSYQKRGESTYEDAVTTEVTSYDANLEAYVEYKVSKDMTLRLTGDNLLDADVTENMKNYDSLADKLANDVDSYETQVERAGPVFMLTLSGNF
ncbi:MAG: TonB-dependent receptor [Epsilonproteobacteria bacterium]|nr:TonB-dependent receptor [Campylobacterota bacterium]